METKLITCPLCSEKMYVDGDHLRCSADTLHVCLVKEWERYENGDVTMGFIIWRMKVRRGKMVRGK